MSKIAEKLIHKRLVTFTEKINSILYSNQYGCRSGHSTINAVTKFVVDCIKCHCLDTIDHRLLLDTLEFYGAMG